MGGNLPFIRPGLNGEVVPEVVIPKPGSSGCPGTAGKDLITSFDEVVGFREDRGWEAELLGALEIDDTNDGAATWR